MENRFDIYMVRAVGASILVQAVLPTFLKSISTGGIHLQFSLGLLLGVVAAIGIFDSKAYGRTCGLVFSWLALLQVVIFVGFISLLLPKVIPQMSFKSTAIGIAKSPSWATLVLILSCWQIAVLSAGRYKQIFIGTEKYTEQDKSVLTFLKIGLYFLFFIFLLAAVVVAVIYFYFGDSIREKMKAAAAKQAPIQTHSAPLAQIPTEIKGEITKGAPVIKVTKGDGTVFIDKQSGLDRALSITSGSQWYLQEKESPDAWTFKKVIATGPISNGGTLLNFPVDGIPRDATVRKLGNFRVMVDEKEVGK